MSRRLDVALRELRAGEGVTQRELADRAGLSVGSLRDLEQGRVSSPRPDTLRRLAAALVLSPLETAELIRLGRGERAPHEPWIRVLGPLAVAVDGGEVDLGSAKHRTLLAMLALTPNTAVPVDTLVEAMWGEHAPATAATLVQGHVSRWRRRLQAGRPDDTSGRLLVATEGGYQLTVTAHQLDLLEFRSLVAGARDARRDEDLDIAFECYRRATRLWRGETLADLPDLKAHSGVATLERERTAAVVEFADVAAALGRHDQTVPLLRQAVDADPWHEAAHARLMVALAAGGQQAAALQVFDQVRRRLVDELGTDPGHELTRAHERILRQELSPSETDGGTAVSAHRQLPRDIAHFTGREAELAALHHTVTEAESAGGAVVISAIEGMAGVGKTRLAVHFANQLVRAGRFTDLQLYVDLHGHADEPPAEPAAVLASLLRLLGVAGAQIPDDLDGRAALFRDRLLGRQALLLLDNAADEKQVIPLLPATSSSLVLITSRRVLALDDAHALDLDVFTPEDAHALLVRVVGRHRVAADVTGARRIVDLCGRLPLAVTLAAHRLRSRPAWRCGDLAARLAEATDRLGELAVGVRRVRAVFDLSYDSLDPVAQRLFRLLGLHPGDDFTVASAAALAGESRTAVRRTLDRLLDEHLVIQVTADRFRVHDLLREYATAQAATHDGAAGTAAAVDRVLRWYLHAARSAVQTLAPHWRWRLNLDGQAPPPDLPTFADDNHGLRWLTAERAILVAAVSLAARQGLFAVAWQLPAVLRPFFEHVSDWDGRVTTSRFGLAAARQAGDRHGEAQILNGLGFAYGQVDRFDEATAYFSRSLEICRELGDRDAEARTLSNLGAICSRQGDFSAAVEHLSAALERHRESGSLADQATALNNLGLSHTRAGQHRDAIRCLQRALEIRRRLADAFGAAGVLDSLGEAFTAAGRHQEAVDTLSEAIQIFRDKRSRGYEARTLETLGNALLAAGRPTQAKEYWQRSLDIFDQLGHPYADTVRARLADGTADS